jgi:hypothetical protein
LGDKNGTRMLFVELRAMEYNDNKVAAKGELVMVD